MKQIVFKYWIVKWTATFRDVDNWVHRITGVQILMRERWRRPGQLGIELMHTMYIVDPKDVVTKQMYTIGYSSHSFTVSMSRFMLMWVVSSAWLLIAVTPRSGRWDRAWGRTLTSFEIWPSERRSWHLDVASPSTTWTTCKHNLQIV